MGAERWRYADTLEAITARFETYYLDSCGDPVDVFAAGVLRETSGTGRPDKYRFDPSDVEGPEIDAEARTRGGSLVDQSVTLALLGKCLVYHSAPLKQDIEMSGFFRLAAWIAIDCPDTDLYVAIYEIGLDGGSIRLSTDAIRARYREGARKQRLIETREPLWYDFAKFTFVSRVVRKGHRLRLVVSPMGRLIETTFAEKNYNGGGVVAEETVSDARTVTVSLYHDTDRPSSLYVPIGKNEDESEASERQGSGTGSGNNLMQF